MLLKYKCNVCVIFIIFHIKYTTKTLFLCFLCLCLFDTMASTHTTIHEIFDKRETIIDLDPAVLDEVLEQDKALVNNIIYALYVCKHPERYFSSFWQRFERIQTLFNFLVFLFLGFALPGVFHAHLHIIL
jgi:hypothetical protein